MTTFQLDVTAAKSKRSSKDMKEEEKQEILDYLKLHADDEKAIPAMMEEHNCSATTIGMLVMEDLLQSKNR